MSNVNFITYKTATGEITGTGSVPAEAVALQPGAGEGVIEHDPPSPYYKVNLGTLLPELDATLVPQEFALTVNNAEIDLGGDEATIAGIPAGAFISIADANGTTNLTADGTTLEITADEAGPILVTISKAGYATARVTITAVE